MLSESEKAGLRADLDLDALERLLTRLSQPERERVIRFFSVAQPEHRSRAPVGRTISESLPQPVLADAGLRALFDKVSQPARLMQRAHLRAHFPADWKEVERRFVLIERVEADDSDPKAIVIHRRPADKGGDHVVLPPGRVDFDSLLLAFDALMSAPTPPANSAWVTEHASLLSEKTLAQISAEGRRMIGALSQAFSIATVEDVDGIATGRLMDVWLLGSP